MVKQKSCFFKILYLPIAILLMLGSGCSVPLTPSVSTKALKLDPSEQKIPLKAVVVFSKKFKDLKITDWIDKGKSKPDEHGIINVKVGKSSVKLFKKTFPLLFEEVEFMTKDITPRDYEILIIPEIVEAKAYLEENRSPTYIEYKVSLFGPGGQLIFQTSARGSAYNKPGFVGWCSAVLAVLGTGFVGTGTYASLIIASPLPKHKHKL